MYQSGGKQLHPWHTSYAESDDGTHWKIRDQPCIVMDQKWEVKDQVYPMVINSQGVYLMLYGCYWGDDKHTTSGMCPGENRGRRSANPAGSAASEIAV